MTDADSVEREPIGNQQTIGCCRHGQRPWTHIICDACGALFDLSEPEGSPRSADIMEGKCPACGAALLPSIGGVVFTARAVCLDCAKELVEKRPDTYFESDPDWVPSKEYPARSRQ